MWTLSTKTRLNSEMIVSASSPELSSRESVAELLASFERGEIEAPHWTHAAHVAAAGALLLDTTADDALPRMRLGIQRLNAYNNVPTTLTRGYHESITRLWVAVCNAFLRESRLPPLEALRALVSHYGDRSKLHREYYSYDVLTSADARSSWQPPDLQPLPAAWRRGELWITCNPSFFQTDVIHSFLTKSYWSPGIPHSVVERAIRGSLGFGVFAGENQVGFARVVTDYATYGYLADVFVLETHRGKGLAKWLVECVLAHPSLHGFRRWQLATRDAHSLYERFGFRVPEDASRLMEMLNRDVYQKPDEKK